MNQSLMKQNQENKYETRVNCNTKTGLEYQNQRRKSEKEIYTQIARRPKNKTQFTPSPPTHY